MEAMPVSSFVRRTSAVETPRAAAAGDPLPPDLAEALCDLRGARETAREDGFPEPSGVAIENAERLLRAMYGIWPCRFWTYPTSDGKIAIDTPGGVDGSVVLLCDSDGGALCLALIGEWQDHRVYRPAPARPDAFLREALTDLKATSGEGRRRGA